MTTTPNTTSDVRTDPWLGTLVHVVASRQHRPNLPSDGCPFCVGGIEATEPYTVKAIPNRWPPMPSDRCEVVLYSSDHHARLATLDSRNLAELVNTWAARTEVLGTRNDVDYVLIFENSGREVGATIDHPHGQIYAFDHVPDRPRRRLAAGWKPDSTPERLIIQRDGWVASVPSTSPYPLAVEIAPMERAIDLVSLDPQQRNAFGNILQDVLCRIEGFYGEPTPTMMWFNQRPLLSNERALKIEGYDEAWFNVEIVSPWRAPNVMRYIAAAEVATNEYFIPVVPEELAARLRDAAPPQSTTPTR
jgi:UDPglucose--hexose-1-phosphate uridylyltransferase